MQVWGQCGVGMGWPHIFDFGNSPKSVGLKNMGKLTAISVKAALAAPGTYQDGDGLFLKVKPSGAASWYLRIQHDGKRRDMGIGSAKLVTLAMARDCRRLGGGAPPWGGPPSGARR